MAIGDFSRISRRVPRHVDAAQHSRPRPAAAAYCARPPCPCGPSRRCSRRSRPPMTHPGLQPRAPVQQQENGVGRSLRLAQQVAAACTVVRHQNEALLRRAVSTTAIGSERARPCTISRLERLPALDSGRQSPPTGASTRPPRSAARGSQRFRFLFPPMRGLGRCPAASSQVEVAAELRDPPPTH